MTLQTLAGRCVPRGVFCPFSREGRSEDGGFRLLGVPCGAAVYPFRPLIGAGAFYPQPMAASIIEARLMLWHAAEAR